MQHQPSSVVRGHARPYVLATFLMGVPVLALLAVPVYSHKDPVIVGLPMFYWWSFLWIALISVGTGLSFRIIEGSKRRDLEGGRS